VINKTPVYHESQGKPKRGAAFAIFIVSGNGSLLTAPGDAQKAPG